MGRKSLYSLGKVLLGTSPNKSRRVATPNKIKIQNTYKTRGDLAIMPHAERTACDIFALFYGNTEGAIQVKEESLPLTTFANCVHTFCEQLKKDPAPIQRVATLWNQLTVTSHPRTYKSECTAYNSYFYAPNYEHEKLLIFAGLMAVVKLSFPDEEKVSAIIQAIRSAAHAKDNEAYFNRFDKAIHTFMPNEVSVPLCDIIDYVRSSTKPYKAFTLYEMLCSQFAHHEDALSYIKSECEGIRMEEPELGTHIENVNVNDGGAMNMIEGSTVQTGSTLLTTNESQNQLNHEN